MNEKVKVARFHRASGIAIVRSRTGKLHVAHIMGRRLRKIRNNSCISAIFTYRGRGEVR